MTIKTKHLQTTSVRYKENCPKCGFIHPSTRKECGDDIREVERKICNKCGKEYLIIYVNGKLVAYSTDCVCYRYQEYGKELTMSDDLKISKEKVLEASKKCPQAKEVLKTLFPDVFKAKVELVAGDIYVHESDNFLYYYLVVEHNGINFLCALGSQYQASKGYVYTDPEFAIKERIERGDYVRIGNLDAFAGVLEELRKRKC